MAQTIFVLNGPNLNLLGTREPDIYGRATLADVEDLCRRTAEHHGFAVDFRQSNHEGDLVDAVQDAARSGAVGLVINPAGYTTSSVALHDAILGSKLPTIEVHISNIFARERFRHRSLVAPVARASLCGFGVEGYALAITGLAAMIAAQPGAAG